MQKNNALQSGLFYQTLSALHEEVRVSSFRVNKVAVCLISNEEIKPQSTRCLVTPGEFQIHVLRLYPYTH